MGFLYWVLVLCCSSLCPVKFCNHLAEEEISGCFTLNVILLSCECLYSVSLPRGAVGKYVVFDCCNFWSFALVCCCWVFFWLLIFIFLRGGARSFGVVIYTPQNNLRTFTINYSSDAFCLECISKTNFTI